MRAGAGQCFEHHFADQKARNVSNQSVHAALLHRKATNALKGMKYPHKNARPFASHIDFL